MPAAVQALQLPAGTGHAWAAGEAHAIAEVRRSIDEMLERGDIAHQGDHRDVLDAVEDVTVAVGGHGAGRGRDPGGGFMDDLDLVRPAPRLKVFDGDQR